MTKNPFDEHNEMKAIRTIEGRVGFGAYPLAKWEDVSREWLEFVVTPACLTSTANKMKARMEIENRKIKYPVSKL